MKTQMVSMSNDISEVKDNVKEINRKIESLMLSWEAARGTYVSSEAHNAALQAVRTELTQQLDKHTKEHTAQVVELSVEVKKLSSAYLKMVGAGVVGGIILSQLKLIIEWLS